MENSNTTATKSSERHQRPVQMVRPLEGRMLGGVAKGVANNFGFADWIPRVFFVVTAFIGGLGIVLYTAAWAFIRSEDEDESPAERLFTGATGLRGWIGIACILLAAIVVLDNFTILAGEVVWAAVLLTVGLMLYLGYFPPGSKSDSQPPSESKEGVQQMTTTDTHIADTEQTTGDSPAGGVPTPPPPHVPTPPTPPALPPAPPRERSFLGRLTVGAMLMGLGILSILDNIESVPIEAQPRHYMAMAVTILGVGLLVGSLAGRARWLMIVGAVLVPTLLFSPAFEYDWDTVTFDSNFAPTSFEQLDAGFSSEVGQMRIDLTRLDWDGQAVDLIADLDIGQLTIIVPEDVGLFGTADVNIGAVQTQNRVNAGFGRHTIEFDDPGPAGEVHLDVHVDIGDIDITTR